MQKWMDDLRLAISMVLESREFEKMPVTMLTQVLNDIVSSYKETDDDE